MPRKTRKQLVGRAEDVARAESERRLAKLERELHEQPERPARAATEEADDTPIPPDEDGEDS